MACKKRALRSRRPHACGDVFCAEPGRPHPRPVRTGPVHEGNSYKMNMHADKKSDEAIRAEKRPNNGGMPLAEAVEQRSSPEGNGRQTAAARTQRRSPASNGLAAVRQAAQRNKQTRFTSLLHHITVDLLKQSFRALERNAAPGIDGVTWYAYQEENLEEKLKDLHGRIHRGSYRARPAKAGRAR